ncbi:MAG: isocitrate/isopropylmalate dehydrogenase family protein [Legionellales bacterium]
MMTSERLLRIAVLPGDGIGAEVTLAALPVFAALKIPVELCFGDIGWHFWEEEGTPIPARTWDLIGQCDTTLLGAITSKPHQEAMQALSAKCRDKNRSYVSPIIQLRQKLRLFANVRPCFNIQKGTTLFDFCVIRENTEGLYAGFDYYPIPSQLLSLLENNPDWSTLPADEVSCTLRLQTKTGLTRLFVFAFEYALHHQMKNVTLADKPNVFRQSSHFVRTIFEAVAAQYPQITADILNVDAVALWMVRRPEMFDVIVAENMFGDILSDVGAGVMGGLGLAPSANLGPDSCYFEPVHGSAPRIGRNKANPCAMFLTIGLLLEHFNYKNQAQIIRDAVVKVVTSGQCVTYDLGGYASTQEMAQAILRAVS